MHHSHSSRLRLWEGWARTAVGDLSPTAGGALAPGCPVPDDSAHRLYACEALEPPSPPLARPEEGVEPYTLQWFLGVENHRHRGRGRWIPRLLEFAKHSGETLLGLGNGLGTDWLQYARHGAEVVVCSPLADQLSLIRRNFELRGLAGRFLHARGDALPLESASIDVACVSSLLHEAGDVRGMVHEIYRVLKPGGKVVAVAPASYDIDFWLHLCFPWRRWLGRPAAAGEPPPRRFTAHRLRRVFDCFIERRVYKRHLRRSELPYLWRWLPTPVWERLVGHLLVLKGFKPLRSAVVARAAA